MITLEDYFKGRDVKYKDDFTDEILKHAKVTVEKANDLLGAANLTRGCTSGWRPYSLQMQINPRAPNSKHITGDAIDIEDADGKLKEFIQNNEHILEKLNIYMEHPSATKTWVHIQLIPPKSKKRIFYP